MKRLATPSLTCLIAWIAISALAASCKHKTSPPLPQAKTPALHYTPLPDPPTPTLRPGQPTRPPEPAC
ncbi:MAG TPA: hypothetical protein VF376_01370 [Thermoanaerobaculia bacterium]